jgi:hypothetical protein
VEIDKTVKMLAAAPPFFPSLDEPKRIRVHLESFEALPVPMSEPVKLNAGRWISPPTHAF